MSSALIVEDNNLLGKIILKKHGNDIIVGESNISKIIANRVDDIITFSNSQDILNKIKGVIICLGFSSRYVGKDMYDNKVYNFNDKEFNETYVYGIQDKYDIPAGIVMYHKSNKLLFECTNIEFMIQEHIISFKYTNINNNIYLVNRADGSIQDTCIIPNGGVYIKNDSLRINNNFSSDSNESLNPGVLNDLQKSVKLSEFLDVNKIKLEVKLPYFTKSIIESQDEHIKEVLCYYNSKLDEFSKFITDKYGDLLNIIMLI
jgi:hypothetical protein